jgi:hypothetical protein
MFLSEKIAPQILEFRGMVRGAGNKLLVLAIGVLVLIAMIEGAIELAARPTFWQKSTWLLYDPYRPDTLDRLFTYLKLDGLVDAKPDIISVGDSSGFHSIQPTIVNRYTHGLKYVDLNVGSNQAFDGYMAIAEYMLQRTNTIKYVVLYMFPYWVSEDVALEITANGRTLRDVLVSTKSYVTPPSAALSPHVKYWMFENRAFDGPSFDHKAFFELKDTLQAALGWLPEHDIRHDRIAQTSADGADQRLWYKRLPFMEKSLLNATLHDFNKMVRSYGATLVVAFNPVPARTVIPGEPNSIAREHNLQRFQEENPDVIFLFPHVTKFGDEKYGYFNHISREYSFLTSRRLGMALGNLIANPASVRKYVAQPVRTEPHPDIFWAPTGEPDREALDAAMAFYMYAATADDSYKSRISKRVLDLLQRDPAFGFMMEDARKRIAVLARNDAKLLYDTSQLDGTPISVSGLNHCNPDPGIDWVHVHGTMNFTYQSPGKDLKAPVSWPAKSHIFIPTVVEDGVRKFDGFCAEPTVSTQLLAQP